MNNPTVIALNMLFEMIEPFFGWRFFNEKIH